MIGIIVAEEKELNAVKNIMSNIEEINIYEKTFYKGIIENKNVVVVKSNVGKVNSARVCQILIDKFNPKLVKSITILCISFEFSFILIFALFV